MDSDPNTTRKHKYVKQKKKKQKQERERERGKLHLVDYSLTKIGLYEGNGYQTLEPTAPVKVRCIQ